VCARAEPTDALGRSSAALNLSVGEKSGRNGLGTPVFSDKVGKTSVSYIVVICQALAQQPENVHG